MEWRDIVGFEGFYQVSDRGLVKSVERTLTFVKNGKAMSRINGERVLSGWIDKDGYTLVSLYEGSKSGTYKVHRLTASTFIPNPDNLPCVLHLDDNPSNNEVTNLRWGTQTDNISDMMSKNRQVKGSSQGGSKLTESDVVDIWNRLKLSESQTSIAKSHNISQTVVSRINRGTLWNHLTSKLK